MRRLSFCLFLVIATMALLTCSTPTTSTSDSQSSSFYTDSVLPSSFIIRIPVSLAAIATASTDSSSATAIPSTRTAKSTTSPSSSYALTSGGYFQIKAMTMLTNSFISLFELYGVIIDAVISQNKLPPGTYATENVTLTQAMYNTIASQLPESEVPPTSIIGAQEALNDLVYSTSNPNTFVNSVQIILTSAANPMTMIYAWTADRTKLKMTLQESSQNSSLVITYDSSSQSSAIQNAMSGSTMRMAIKSDSASTAHGVYAEMSFIDGGSTYSVSGYADDNGGLVKTVFDIGSDYYSSYFFEGFDSTGNLLLAETSSDDSTWNIDTFYSDTAPLTTYGSQATDAASMTYSAILLLSA